MTLALAVGLGIASPTEALAKQKKIEVVSIEHCNGYDYVEFNDGSFGLFYDDGTYVIYMRKQG